jgi:hypothetical protein
MRPRWRSSRAAEAAAAAAMASTVAAAAALPDDCAIASISSCHITVTFIAFASTGMCTCASAFASKVVLELTVSTRWIGFGCMAKEPEAL